MAEAIFAAGCFWGIEHTFRNTEGVTDTAVGYIGGTTENPTYEEVCTGRTGHAEAVRVEFDPAKVTYEVLLAVFWQSHDPTQVNRQGPDVGTQYRTGIFYLDEAQKTAAEKSKAALNDSGQIRSEIATEITAATTFYMAEDYHQQYFEKRRGIGGFFGH
ncbi:MAG TPA: peptide-methionine (S)-S-oxide reductase [Rhodospirillaceae bacterium]|nr:peptide-methionine (S)-S-oxide reductase [Rhodospirillaceae bacterium]HAT34857.1 peptide-methionine (S)-S-oxide reductase [Rhodospirillaceae bacterium]